MNDWRTMIIQNLPVLHVVIPLLGAGLCAFVRSGRFAWKITFAASGVAFASVVLLCVLEAEQNGLLYYLGGWEPPAGIEYQIDRLTAYILLLVTFIAMVTVFFAKHSVAAEIPASRQPFFYATFLLCLAGLVGIVTTNDVFNIYVFLEISSLATYALIAMGNNRKALTAAFEYLILGTIGATFFLIGIGLLYMMTGTLNITDMANRLPDVENMRPVQAAFAFMAIGLVLKMALFPLHIWLTNAYAYAPSFISAFLASTATKVSIYVFLRMVYHLFGAEFSFGEMLLSLILFILAIAAMLVGSFAAIYQPNIKRMLAFSSVAQVGYIVMGIALATHLGLMASITHLANHALAKGALFLALGALFLRTGSIYLHDFRGAGRAMPLTMAGFVVGGLSLIGIPGTAGFISKFVLLQALIEQGYWWAVILVLFTSLLAVIYIWKVVEVAYFQPRLANQKRLTEVPLRMVLALWILVGANLYLGIQTEVTLDNAAEAASVLQMLAR